MLIRSLKRRIRERLAEYDAIVLWGAATGGRYALVLLPNRVDYIVDSFSDQDELQGLPIRRPEALRQEERRIVIIVASFAVREVEDWCQSNEIRQPRISLHDLFVDVLGVRGEMGRLRIDLLTYYLDGWFETFVTQPQILVNVTYRLCAALRGRNSLLSRIALVPLRLLHALTGALFGIDIPITVVAGPGLQFAHYGGIVLHEGVEMGAYCKLYQCVTLGTDKTGRPPWLGDHVIVWSNAVVIGGCRLGDFTQVGTNAVCLGDVDVVDVSLVGTPARVVERNPDAPSRTNVTGIS